jgi:hypothetical protein
MDLLPSVQELQPGIGASSLVIGLAARLSKTIQIVMLCLTESVNCHRNDAKHQIVRRSLPEHSLPE